MKKTTFIFFAVLMLVACSANQVVTGWVDTYSKDNIPRAEAGEIKWSDYYQGVLSRVERLPDSVTVKSSMVTEYSEGVAMSKKYEAGQLSKADFFKWRETASQKEKFIASQVADSKDICSSFIKVQQDEFTKKSTIASETCYNRSNTLDSSGYRFSSGSRDNFILTLSASYWSRDWRNYSYAIDANGKRYEPAFPITRKVMDCSGGKNCTFLEIMSTTLTRKDMEAIANSSGINIRFDSGYPSDSKMIHIDTSIVQAMLDKNNEIFPSIPSSQKKNNAIVKSQPSASSGGSESMEQAKTKCLDLGFKSGTESFGQCILKISK